jgi:hypothetical protein
MTGEITDDSLQKAEVFFVGDAGYADDLVAEGPESSFIRIAGFTRS